MKDIKYIGEHLWLGQVGHLAMLLAFTSALLAAWSFYKSHKDVSWSKVGRSAYIVHGLSILTVIGLILFAMVSRYYEYDYVFRTVSDSSQMRYLLAAFWADQEGSFLLWMFWHVILGWIILRYGKTWTAPTMITLALIQAFLSSMLLGVYLPFFEGDVKIGSNPFIFVRDVYDIPLFANADYLTLIEGRGLNPLLQNYWMTIHPPVLFLGFASVSIPFCYAVGAMMTQRHQEVLQPMLKWSQFSGFIYGLGILMGAAWAYEALTFGGYWAWDPVENSSLVPWLILIAGLHTNLIAKATGYSLRTTYIYYILAFVFIVYSTFLTRSGILGDTSVHAFTTMGLENQLLMFMGFFLLMGFYWYIKSAKTIPTKPQEEKIQSREFWMFVGALVLCFSGLLMTVSTSLPVYNKIVEVFTPNHIPIAIDDPMTHHNRFQIWIGVFIGFLSGLSILLRYRAAGWESYKKKYGTQVLIHLALTGIFTLLIGRTLQTDAWQHYAFLAAGVFAVLSNGHYLWQYGKANLKSASSSISHLGFGILIFGILYSGLNKKTITASHFAQADFTQGEGVDKYVVLIKDLPRFANNYWMQYRSDTLINNVRSYRIDFTEIDAQEKVIDQFVTYPSMTYNRDFTKAEAFNPGNIRRWTYDVFTAAQPNDHLVDMEILNQVEDSLVYQPTEIIIGDTLETEEYSLVMDQPIINYEFERTRHQKDTSEYDITVGLPMHIKVKRTGNTYDITPGLGLMDALVIQVPEVVDELGIKIKVPEEIFSQIFTEEEGLTYDNIILKDQESIDWQGYKIQLNGFDRSGNYPRYKAKEGDIALGAKLKVIGPDGRQSDLLPVFILRNNQQLSIKDYSPELALHARFVNINPNTAEMQFRIAKDERDTDKLNLLIAEDVPRSDILIVESNIFPGMNLVWLGTLMMLAGLLMSLVSKRRTLVEN